MRCKATSSVDDEVMAAALRWWQMHRPISWNYRKHAENPTVNMTTPSEHRLALAVAKREEAKRGR